MQEQQRYDKRAPFGPGGSDPEDNLDQLRARADSFLDAGDQAINRALASSDSESFLRASRQQGGE